MNEFKEGFKTGVARGIKQWIRIFETFLLILAALGLSKMLGGSIAFWMGVIAITLIVDLKHRKV